MKPRRRFSEKDVIRTLLFQGVEIRCYRTKEPITLENAAFVEREHLHERELGGPDEPGNCRYSLDTAHAVVTNGTGATSAGSSKQRIAKAKRIEREVKFAVVKTVEPLLLCWGGDAPCACGAILSEDEQTVLGCDQLTPKPPKRKIQSKGFEKGHRPMRGRA